MSGAITRSILYAIDAAARLLPRQRRTPAHLRTGRRGEEEAYFYLRRHGYVIIARNFRGANSRSELDLVGWDGDTLCFIEVKTRTAHDVQPAEAAVDLAKRRDVSDIAREFLRKVKGNPPFRFDVVSVYLDSKPSEIELFKNAFSLA